MIDADLERALAPLVERAPGGPPLSRLQARARARRRNRSLGRASAAVVIVALVSAVTVAVSHRGRAHRVVTGPTAPPLPTAAFQLTTPDGTTYSVGGSPDLGLRTARVRFYGQVNVALDTQVEYVVQRSGGVSAARPCRASYGFGEWTLFLCGTTAQVGRARAALAPEVDAAGALELHPAPGVELAPADAPDVMFGDDAIGIFGPKWYPTGCPTAATATAHTAAGAPARVDATGAWWCDAGQFVRVHVGDRSLVAAALRSLTVAVQPIVTDATSLYGDAVRVSSPGIALGSPGFDASLALAASQSPLPGPFAVVVSKEPLPAPVSNGLDFATADGHRMFRASTALGQPVLAGVWSGWNVTVTIDGLDGAGISRLAAAMRFRVEGGFLVLDPAGPYAVTGPGGTEIVLGPVRVDARGTAVCAGGTASALRAGDGARVRIAGSLYTWRPAGTGLCVYLAKDTPGAPALLGGLRVTRAGGS